MRAVVLGAWAGQPRAAALWSRQPLCRAYLVRGNHVARRHAEIRLGRSQLHNAAWCQVLDVVGERIQTRLARGYLIVRVQRHIKGSCRIGGQEG